MRNVLFGALAVMTLSTPAFAQGTEAEAKAMLTKAVAAVKTDQVKAVAMFTAGEGGFLDRDLYVFCMNTGDGKIATTQAKQLIGTDARALKDRVLKHRHIINTKLKRPRNYSHWTKVLCSHTA